MRGLPEALQQAGALALIPRTAPSQLLQFARLYKWVVLGQFLPLRCFVVVRAAVSFRVAMRCAKHEPALALETGQTNLLLANPAFFLGRPRGTRIASGGGRWWCWSHRVALGWFPSNDIGRDRRLAPRSAPLKSDGLRSGVALIFRLILHFSFLSSGSIPITFGTQAHARWVREESTVVRAKRGLPGLLNALVLVVVGTHPGLGTTRLRPPSCWMASRVTDGTQAGVPKVFGYSLVQLKRASLSCASFSSF